jgi:hypothetical protein
VRGLILIAVCTIVGCAAASQHDRAGDEWVFDGKPHDISADDPDDAESRWRQEIAAQHWTDERDMLDRDKLLTDAPPGRPSEYGKVASDSGNANEADPERSQNFWDNVGRGTFAALTVAATLGMMAAPYLLF